MVIIYMNYLYIYKTVNTVYCIQLISSGIETKLRYSHMSNIFFDEGQKLFFLINCMH